MRELSIREERNVMYIDFNLLEDWNSFDIIVQVLVNYFKAKVIKGVDGPESRVWTFTIDDSIISLHNNPYGNSLKGKTYESHNILKFIFANWSIYSKL